MVTLYTATWCGFCHTAKRYLDQIGVKYDDKDIEKEQKYAAEAVEKSGQMGIPVLDIAGTIIVGFDKPKIDEALRSNKLLS